MLSLALAGNTIKSITVKPREKGLIIRVSHFQREPVILPEECLLMLTSFDFPVALW